MKLAMVFPGQGSQHTGMLAELAMEYPIIEETFNQASSALGYDLWSLCQQENKAEALNKTWNTQPALLAASVAIYRLWQQQNGVLPSLLAGHSLGEYSALTCAGVISFTDAIKLVALRGKLMQEAVPEGIGAMAAIIGLDNESIIKACQEAAQSEVVAPVNFNSPGQVVIAGHKEAVLRACNACKAAGAKRALVLPISVPSHCELMKPAAEKLADMLKDIPFHQPTLPVINNVDVAITHKPDEIKQALIRQLFNPVRWTETINTMNQYPLDCILEIGPGKVLTGLIKRINNHLTVTTVNNLESLQEALTRFTKK